MLLCKHKQKQVTLIIKGDIIRFLPLSEIEIVYLKPLGNYDNHKIGYGKISWITEESREEFSTTTKKKWSANQLCVVQLYANVMT